jgi:hypothetical protein
MKQIVVSVDEQNVVVDPQAGRRRSDAVRNHQL